MTDRSFMDRMWPSLVALVGTVAVVVALLVAFGDRLDDDSEGDQTVAGGSGDAGDDPLADPTDGATNDGGAADGNGSGDESGGNGGEESDGGTDEESGADADGDEPEPSVTTAAPEDREPLGVLNGTTTDGLETDAQEVFEDGGWEVPAVATYDEDVEVSTVYYPDGMEDAADALMGQFPEIVESAPTIEGLNSSRLVVILGEDYAASTGAGS